MEIEKIEDMILLAGSKEYILEGASRTVPDHEVQMEQRERGGQSRWEKGCAKAW